MANPRQYLQTVMADRKLGDLLTEFQNLAESEHHGHIDTIVSRHDNRTTIFAALTLFEVGQLSSLHQTLTDCFYRTKPSLMSS